MEGSTILELVNYGTLGLLVLGLISGKIATGRERDREAARADKAESELAAIRLKVEDQVIPLLTRATDLMARETAERERLEIELGGRRRSGLQ